MKNNLFHFCRRNRQSPRVIKKLFPRPLIQRRLPLNPRWRCNLNTHQSISIPTKNHTQQQQQQRNQEGRETYRQNLKPAQLTHLLPPRTPTSRPPNRTYLLAPLPPLPFRLFGHPGRPPRKILPRRIILLRIPRNLLTPHNIAHLRRQPRNNLFLHDRLVEDIVCGATTKCRDAREFLEERPACFFEFGGEGVHACVAGVGRGGRRRRGGCAGRGGGEGEEICWCGVYEVELGFYF